MKFRIILLVVSLVLSGLAFAEQDIKSLQGKVRLHTEVMIFGSAHLQTVKQTLNAESLSTVVEVLEVFKPTAVAVEALRPEDITAMLNGADEYKEVLEQFVGNEFLELANKEQIDLRVTATMAIAKMNLLLDSTDLSAEITAKKRVELIKLAVASYNKDTALLHWKYLAGRSSTVRISPDLKEYLNKLAAANNEKNLIASELALRLKLNRIYSIDDHLDKDMYSAVVSRLMDSYGSSKAAASLVKSDYVNEPEKLKSQALKSGDWLPLFLWVNGKEYQSDVIDKEWRLFVDKDLAIKPALERLALWEIRNLNMASNIMRVVADNIGGRVVVVVGASHKVFLDDYLSKMIGVKVVSFNDTATGGN